MNRFQADQLPQCENCGDYSEYLEQGLCEDCYIAFAIDTQENKYDRD